MLVLVLMLAVITVLTITPRFDVTRRAATRLSKTYTACNPLGAAMFGIVLGTWLAVGYDIGWKDAVIATGICTAFAVDDWWRRHRGVGCVGEKSTDTGDGHEVQAQASGPEGPA